VVIGAATGQESYTYPATSDPLGRTFFGRIAASF